MIRRAARASMPPWFGASRSAHRRSWLRQPLEAVGVRSINNIVDATNYVMLELGQPMHAYDLATLKGPALVARRARAGEKLVTLDGAERTLDGETTVIADAARVVGIGGIMGGARHRGARRHQRPRARSCLVRAHPHPSRAPGARPQHRGEPSVRAGRGPVECRRGDAALPGDHPAHRGRHDRGQPGGPAPGRGQSTPHLPPPGPGEAGAGARARTARGGAVPGRDRCHGGGEAR